MILSYSFGVCVYIYIMWMIFYWWNYMLTCRGVSSPNGAKDAKLQACGWSMLVIKCAPNCASCWGSLLLIISISPPSYNFSTHWEATESDVMPFKLPSKPRSCSKRHQDAKFKWLKTISMNIILWTLLYIYIYIKPELQLTISLWSSPRKRKLKFHQKQKEKTQRKGSDKIKTKVKERVKISVHLDWE